jgi:hypothetical protein
MPATCIQVFRAHRGKRLRRGRAARHSFTRVLLIGPAHYVPVRGIVAPSAARFATPLGEIPVDLEAGASLADAGLISIDDRARHPSIRSRSRCPFYRWCLGVLPDSTPCRRCHSTGGCCGDRRGDGRTHAHRREHRLVPLSQRCGGEPKRLDHRAPRRFSAWPLRCFRLRRAQRSTPCTQGDRVADRAP